MSASSVPSQSVSLVGGDPVLVLDTWPIMEWLRNRPYLAPRFLALIEAAERGEVQLLLSSLNLGEVFYSAWKLQGEAYADQVLRRMLHLPVHVVHPDRGTVLLAARLKARFRISYADAFAVMLAIERGCPVVTGDPEFLDAEILKLIRVNWWGA